MQLKIAAFTRNFDLKGSTQLILVIGVRFFQIKNAIRPKPDVGFLSQNVSYSGWLNPSLADISITNKVKKAAELMDIKLLDHLILAEDNYYSFADEGRM